MYSYKRCLLTQPAPLTLSLGDDQSVDIGEAVSLEPYISNSIENYIWSTSYNLECDRCLEQSVIPMVTTSFELTVVSEDGCLATDEVVVFVDRNAEVFVPNIFSPNGDGFNDLWVVENIPNVVELQFNIIDRSKFGYTKNYPILLRRSSQSHFSKMESRTLLTGDVNR